MNNVCACAKSHGSRWRQRPGRHNKLRKMAAFLKSFAQLPVFGEEVETY